jgi:hypothetical protein
VLGGILSTYTWYQQNGMEFENFNIEMLTTLRINLISSSSLFYSVTAGTVTLSLTAQRIAMTRCRWLDESDVNYLALPFACLLEQQVEKTGGIY